MDNGDPGHDVWVGRCRCVGDRSHPWRVEIPARDDRVGDVCVQTGGMMLGLHKNSARFYVMVATSRTRTMLCDV
jgi:hypothetical protein